MAKNSLQAVLDRHKAEMPPPAAEGPTAKSEAANEPTAPKFSRPSRTGTKLIAGHFSSAVAKQLRILAAEEETTTQALLEEALDLLFVKKGRGRIAKAGMAKTQ